MANYIIKGGKKLRGTVETKTAKNSAVACMCAALLTQEEVILKETPRIEEVERMKEVLKSIGVKVSWKGSDLRIKAPKALNLEKMNVESAVKTRAVLMLMGVLTHHYANFKIPFSGGCKLGKRTVAPYLFALEKFGIKIKTGEDYYEIKRKNVIKGADVVMYEASDTATENTIMAASLAKGKTVIKFASANYQVQDVCFLLSSMGAKIKGIGTTTLEITGVDSLHGTEYYLVPDPIESMFWIALAATTNFSITIKGCPKDFVSLELLKLEKMGFRYKTLKTYKSKSGNFDLIDIRTSASSLKALEDKIEPRPYPGINIDNLPFFVPIATQAKGKTLIHDWCYENRAIYYMEFQKLGGQMELADPYRVFITGPTKLKPTELVCPPALRPATIIVIGMLAAEGESILRNTYTIDRGYENLYERLKKIGADIRELKE